jgi:hypothetical protein
VTGGGVPLERSTGTPASLSGPDDDGGVPPARGDAVAGLAAAGLFAAAAVAGALLGLSGRPVHAGVAPLFGHWLPHAGPGTPAACAIAALVVWHGPAVAARLRWRPLLAGGYAAAVAWTLALALVDGPQRGLAGRLTTRYEYLSEVPGVVSVPAMLREFTGRILDGGPDPWTTHVAGHPPGALLVFVGLDRIGLGGGTWAALACVLAGAAVAVAVPVTLRALAGEGAARAAVPFLVLFPGAVWIGASADGLFAGVAATGIACLAVGLTRPSAPAGLTGGVLLATCLYLSYGLVLIGLVAAAVVLLAGRRRPLVWAVAGAVAVVAAFTAAGFWWLDGYDLVRQRYYQGLASERPYGYWVWANLAALAACAGPAAAAVLRRAVGRDSAVVLRRAAGPASAVVLRRAAGPENRRVPGRAVALLPLAAFAAVLAADLSGLSKAEVERIWLPFAVWLPAGAVLLPHPRRWLAAQALTALLINHLLLTGW